MVKKHFGISIQGDRLSGVAVDLQGKRARILACAEIGFGGPDDLAESLEQLQALLELQQAEGLLGLPLSMVSVRNLEFPFTDTKKISQALPFELDDQLLQPVDEMVMDFSVAEIEDHRSRVLAFATEKEPLRLLIEQMTAGSIEPRGVVPGIVALAESVGREYREGWYLVVQTETASVTMALLCNGVCHFCRRLSYPEEMVLQPPFRLDHGRLEIVDMQGAEFCVQAMAAAVGRSLGFLKLSGLPVDTVQGAVVTGIMAGDPTMLDILGEALDMEVVGVSVSSFLDVDAQGESVGQLKTGRFETALCLAMQGATGKPSYNFRRGELAAKRKLFSSKRQMVSLAAAVLSIPLLLLAFYLYDQARLRERNDALRAEILKIYRDAFPAATRVQDPYVQMKVSIRELEAAGASVPAHSGRLPSLDYLADISERIPITLPLEVKRLVIDNQAVRMRGVTENFNRVDEIKNRLSASPYYVSVQIMSATADKKTGKIRFELQLLLGEI